MHQSDLPSCPSMRFLHDLIDDPDAPLDEHARPRIAAGRTITARAHLETLQQREAMKQSFAVALDGIDALLTSTTLTAALPLDEVDQTSASAHYTRFGNFLDLCALAAEWLCTRRASDLPPDAAPTKRQPRCGSALPIRTRQIGIFAGRPSRWSLRTKCHDRP